MGRRSAVPPTLTKTHFGLLVLSLRITVAIRVTLLKSDPLQLSSHWLPSFALQLPGVIPTKSQQMTLSVGDVTPWIGFLCGTCPVQSSYGIRMYIS